MLGLVSLVCSVLVIFFVIFLSAPLSLSICVYVPVSVHSSISMHVFVFIFVYVLFPCLFVYLSLLLSIFVMLCHFPSVSVSIAVRRVSAFISLNGHIFGSAGRAYLKGSGPVCAVLEMLLLE